MWEINMGKVRTGALALVLLLSMVLSGCGQQSTDTSTAEYLSAEVVQAGSAVKTTESYTGDFFIGFEANTRITALRVTELLWEYSGDRYVSIKVKEGDFVSEGDVMVEIAPTISESELLQRELDVTNADIDLVQIR